MNRTLYLLLFFAICHSALFAINPHLTRNSIAGRISLEGENYKRALWQWYGQVGGSGNFRIKFENDDMTEGFITVRGYSYEGGRETSGVQYLYVMEELLDGTWTDVIQLVYEPIGTMKDFIVELNQEHISNSDIDRMMIRLQKFVFNTDLEVDDYLKLIEVFDKGYAIGHITESNITELDNVFRIAFGEEKEEEVINYINNKYIKEEMDSGSFYKLLYMILNKGDISRDSYLTEVSLQNCALALKA